MKKFPIQDLAEIIKAEPTTQTGDFADISIDSRTVKPGDCFFAIAGKNFDGHDYVADAIEKGAACAVVSKNRCLNHPGTLKVDDTVRALGDFARQYRRQNNFKVVAITGSVGKTTTKHIAYHALRTRRRVHAAPASYNNNIGLPLTLLHADSDDEIIIAELGSNHPGEMTYLTKIAQPNVAVILNAYPAHLEGFGSLQSVINEKLCISEGLQSDGTLLINGDFENLLRSRSAAPEPSNKNREHSVITFGTSGRCDIRAQNVACTALGGEFAVDGTKVTLPLPGRGNIENALAAYSICSRFGLTIDEFARSLHTLPPVPMRAELLHIGSLTVLNDCYNANPASMKNALAILETLPKSHQKGRLVFICGDMAELAEQTERLHIELGADIAKAKVQLLIAVGKFAKIAAEAARRNANYSFQSEFFPDALSACDNLQKLINDYDIILVKGSRSLKLEKTIEKLSRLFS